MKLINRIKEFISKLSKHMGYSSCYDDMETRGIAVFGMCGGQMGGDANTEYLSYSCIGCPYFVHPNKSLKGDHHE